jgi:hypothetical protein
MNGKVYKRRTGTGSQFYPFLSERLVKSLALFSVIVPMFQQHIEAASDALKQCITVCSRYRKKNTFSESLGKMVKKTNYDQYSRGKLYNVFLFLGSASCCVYYQGY